jgi:protein-disulfide isomerase
MPSTGARRRRRPPAASYALLGGLALLGTGALAMSIRDSGGRLPFGAAGWDAAELARLGDRALGSPDAPLTVVEFADFQCGGCAVYAERQLPRIRSELVEAGLVRYVFMDFPLEMHPQARLAARAGLCASEQGAFWGFHDRVYAGHSEWAYEGDPTATFTGYAAAAGMDRAAFEACLRSTRHDERVAASVALGESIGVRGTPSMVANGRLLEGVPSADLLRRLAQQQRPR